MSVDWRQCQEIGQIHQGVVLTLSTYQVVKVHLYVLDAHLSLFKVNASLILQRLDKYIAGNHLGRATNSRFSGQLVHLMHLFSFEQLFRRQRNFPITNPEG